MRSIAQKRSDSNYYRKNRDTLLAKQKRYREENKKRILKRRRELYRNKRASKK